MNVLLTSSGRRTYLVDYFKEALEGKGLVFASNSVMSPALPRADGYGFSPLIYSEEYIPWLLAFCREHEIGLVVPLFDIDLPVLAKNRKKFEEQGIVLAVSEPETVRIAADKYEMCRYLAANGIHVPETALSVEAAFPFTGDTSAHSAFSGDISTSDLSMDDATTDDASGVDVFMNDASGHALLHPVILKPRFGMGSIGLFEAETDGELRVLYRKCLRKIQESYLKYESASYPEECVLVQQKLTGDEYGLDVICDFNGVYQTTVVRRKIAMRSGETDEAVVLGERNREYMELCKLGKHLAQIFEIHGNMDVDVIMDPAEGIPYVIDINARFGGGYPFSHLAGADLPRAYLAWASGKKAEPAWLTACPGVHGYKDIQMKVFT